MELPARGASVTCYAEQEAPRSRGVKNLPGEDDPGRLRAGDYRVLYQRPDGASLVLCVRTGRRSNAYC